MLHGPAQYPAPHSIKGAYGIENCDGTRSLLRIINAFVVGGLGDVVNGGLQAFICDRYFFLTDGRLSTIAPSLFPKELCNGPPSPDRSYICLVRAFCLVGEALGESF